MSDVSDVFATVDQIAPYLAGKPPAVQGGILAVLLSTWLECHQPAAVRRELLEDHVRAVIRMLGTAPDAEKARARFDA